MRRKNVTAKQKREVVQLLEAGGPVKEVAKKVHLDLSTVYKIRREANKARQAEGPHQQTLRNLIQRWLDEVRQLNPVKLMSPLVEPILSASFMLRCAQQLERQGLENLQMQSGRDHTPQQTVKGQPWVGEVEKDRHFPQLREHLTGDPLWDSYEEMSSTFSDLTAMLICYTLALQGYVVGLMGSTEKDLDAWFERLRQDAVFREQVALVGQPAFFLLGSELLILAIADVGSSPQLDSFRFALEWIQPEWEHKLQGCCSLLGLGLSADKVRHSAREAWEERDHGGAIVNSAWGQLKKDLSSALKLWPAWQTSRDALQQCLVALAEQHPFPGRCGACSV